MTVPINTVRQDVENTIASIRSQIEAYKQSMVRDQIALGELVAREEYYVGILEGLGGGPKLEDVGLDVKDIEAVKKKARDDRERRKMPA